MARKYFIETYGCQMNVHDSERLAGLLEQAGYEATVDDGDADVIVINTCSVREHAEDKLYTRLGEIGAEGRRRGARPLVAVAGCVAQQEGTDIRRRSRDVDVILGTQAIKQLPRLLAQAEVPAFWSSVAAPVLPFNRRDAREFGDLKDAASDSLVGIDIVTDARTPGLAIEMLGLMSGYYVNGIVRERVRTWVLRNRGEAPARQKAARAEIVEAQMKIDTMGRRIQDLKAILARYPDSARIDARQVVSITEGSDRFLSPLVQLVAAETSITQLKETNARTERQARQADLVERYFAQAEEKLGSTPLSSDLVPELSGLTTKRFEGVDPEADWAKEVIFRIQAEIAGFSSAMTSFGIRNEPRASKVPSRDPARLAAFGIGGGLLLLGLVAFVRASLRARSEAGDAEA